MPKRSVRKVKPNRLAQVFGTVALAELSNANEAAKILEGHYHPKRRDGKTPWQFALADYCVRFSEKTPRGTPRKDGGSWGIYLRNYNVRVATFADNSAFLREALTRMFDAAHALAESWKKVERRMGQR
jgi:hypothetical protein